MQVCSGDHPNKRVRLSWLASESNPTHSMKHICKSLLAFIAATAITQGGITLDWEYAFDGATVGAPLDTFTIYGVKVAPTGHVALEVRNTIENEPRRRHMVLVDPQGQQSWVSANLSSFAGEMDSIRILQVGAGTATFVITGDRNESSGLKLMMFNKNASPDFSTRTLTNQQLAMYEPGGASMQLRQPTSAFPTNCIYTLERDPVAADPEALGVSMRKYRLEVPVTAESVVQSTSGSDGPNFVITWNSIQNTVYQIQESNDMITWSNVGQAVTGTGATMSWSSPIDEGATFYRVTEP